MPVAAARKGQGIGFPEGGQFSAQSQAREKWPVRLRAVLFWALLFMRPLWVEEDVVLTLLGPHRHVY